MLETMGEGWRRDVVEEELEPALGQALMSEAKQSGRGVVPVGRLDEPSFVGQ